MSTNRSVCLSTLLVLSGIGVGTGLAQQHPPDPSWFARVSQQIADAEYEVTWQTATALPDLDAAWHAPNRAHGLRTYFTEDGIRVVPRTEDVPSWTWGLT